LDTVTHFLLSHWFQCDNEMHGGKRMHIQGTSSLQGVQPINSPQRPQQAEQAKPAAAPQAADQLDISQEAQLASQVQETPAIQPDAGIRQDKVDAIRAQIEAGAYETDAKLDIALDRLLDELA
jgi:negative regulator of flagellin synthesis FlgM